MIEVMGADEQSDQPVDALRWVRLARAVLEAEGVRGEAEMSLVFVDEPTMRDLNGRFAGTHVGTDVLSFPIDDEPAAGGRTPDSNGSGPNSVPPAPAELPLLIGDVYICPTVARRNAADHGVSYDDEMALLVVHGILHLMGRDHLDDTEAEAMEQRERELLAMFYRPIADGVAT